MYQFSLSSFTVLFQRALEKEPASDDIEERIKRLIRRLEHLVLEFIGRSLLKEDRLMFAMHLVHGMHAKVFKVISALESLWRIDWLGNA